MLFAIFMALFAINSGKSANLMASGMREYAMKSQWRQKKPTPSKRHGWALDEERMLSSLL